MQHYYHSFECKSQVFIQMCDIIRLNEQAEECDFMYCYQRIRDLREDADLNQSALADILSISRQQYSLYERGEREIPFHHVITLAKYYNVSIDYIAGLTNNAECK